MPDNNNRPKEQHHQQQPKKKEKQHQKWKEKDTKRQLPTSDNNSSLRQSTRSTQPQPPHLPLNSEWSFWISTWANGQERCSQLGTVSEVIGFWAHFNHLPLRNIPPDSSLSLFKDGLQPKWEDPANVLGGHFKITLPDHSLVPPTWLDLCLATIGEQFHESEFVCGVSVYIKKKKACSVSVWLSKTEAPLVTKCREWLLGLLPQDGFSSLKFVVHKVLLKNYHDVQKAVDKGSNKQSPHSPVSNPPSSPATHTNSHSRKLRSPTYGGSPVKGRSPNKKKKASTHVPKVHSIT
eukprot:TRINITY_DN62479_c0_g2_i1.p2 TRINITY_DN62479_c0_g2~~TRINITY_DN62479_c0_g2_i1.p2  ORF type:complete len:292 (-),score=41.89 TRINITY_DN62479_c0_g2_i1:1256-2131(-)